MILKGKRIFIVEDNLSNRAIAQMLLEQQGAITAIDRWGTEAIERLKKFAPLDLILMDLMLPHNLTGFDVFDQIRSLSDFDGVPIVAISAADAAVAIPETQEKGFSGFISKPLEFYLFAEQIAQILDGESIWYTSSQM